MTRLRVHETAGTIAPAAGSRLLLRLIDVGEGTSGDYPAGTLIDAAKRRVFPAGTHCYIDHAAAARRGPNGERSIMDLAAVLAEDARWDAASQSLIAEAIILPAWRSTLAGAGPHIGVSISASASVTPAATRGGRPTVAKLVTAESVDFVTRPGRGGKILAVVESVTPAPPPPPPAPDRTRNAFGRDMTAAPPTRNAFGRDMTAAPPTRNAFGRAPEQAPQAPPPPQRTNAFGRQI